MKFSDLRIGTRLGAGFGVMMLLMMMMTIAGIWRLDTVGDVTDELVDSAMAKERLTAEWHNLISVSGGRVLAFARNPELVETREDAEHAAATRVRVNAIQQQLETLLSSPDEKALLAAVVVARKPYAVSRDQLFKFKKAGEQEAAVQLAATVMTQQFNAYLAAVSAIGRHEAEIGRAMAQEVRRENRDSMVSLLVMAAGAMLCGVWCAWALTRSITGPLRQAVQVAKTVASGNLGSAIDVSSKDETGEVLLALKEMNASLVHIVGQVRGGTDTIATASGQIASGNLDLSSRTERQASSLQQTASSMEQLTAAVRQNGDNSRQAHALALSASAVAQKGGQVVSQVVGTMGEINASAQKIADIIGVIDGIAFQTNILALNAAVEAARAGEQGRGFAVVATEVRNLAQRSATAAKEIKTLIVDSVSKVENGAKLVDQAGATMEDIVGHVRRVTDLIGDITAASAEQSTGLGQINDAISEMDQVTQQNAALVEEAAAAADALQEQSTALARLVSSFTLAGLGTREAPVQGRMALRALTAS
ncbi:MAG: MCP four helix bundle domain-containing protein [Burkholderiaceae bacterium]|nr:MCP four helix bundle domain-containing protein [Burkholderiaceae bacterium]